MFLTPTYIGALSAGAAFRCLLWVTAVTADHVGLVFG
jgi:hypothetical protein